MQRFFHLILIVLAFAPIEHLFADDVATSDSCNISGRFREQVGYRVHDSRQFSKIRSIFSPRASCEISEDLSIHTEQRVWYDGVYDWTNGYSATARHELETDYQVRDLYVDYSFGDFDLRAGQVQTVWGETVGLFVADVVNAKDYREFILPDLKEINLPEPTIDLTYTQSNWHTQLIWIPFPRFNKFPPPGSEYQFTAGIPPDSSVPFPYDEPGHSLNNSEFGGRFGYLIDDWDLGFFYLRSWDKTAVYQRTFSDGSLSYQPDYEQVNIVGTTFSKEVSDIVWRGEMVFTQGSKYPVTTVDDADGLSEGNQLSYAIGSDFRINDETRANIQFLQMVLINYNNNYATIADEYQTYLTAMVNSELPSWDAFPEIFFLTSPDFDEGMIRPKIVKEINDYSSVSIGLDWFYGKKDGLFGQFSNRSRTHIEYAADF